MYKPLRGFKLSRQDLITLNELLQQLATEAAMLETADYTKSEEETKEKFDSDKKLVQSLFNVHVRVETESGAVFSQNRGTILQGPDMPQKVTAVEFNTGYSFGKGQTGMLETRLMYSSTFVAVLHLVSTCNQTMRRQTIVRLLWWERTRTG